MSILKHDDNCRGCMPAMIDAQTGKILPDNHPAMKAVLSVWQQSTKEEREAWHSVCVQNSRDPKEVEICMNLTLKFQEAMKFAEEKNETPKA